MFNINVSNNAKLNPRFRKRAKKYKVMRTVEVPTFNKKTGEWENKEQTNILDCEETLTRTQPDCNDCKTKGQRKPRWMRQMLYSLDDLNRDGGVISTYKMLGKRGMLEEESYIYDTPPIQANLRPIQACRRRERDQAQKWNRSGKLVHQATHAARYGMGPDKFNQLTGGPDFENV